MSISAYRCDRCGIIFQTGGFSYSRRQVDKQETTYFHYCGRCDCEHNDFRMELEKEEHDARWAKWNS